MTILYGISNCDTVRAARRWLGDRGVEYRFHDLRKDGVDGALMRTWQAHTDVTQLLNRRSRTWRELQDKDKQDIDAARAAALMQSHPTLIKRPLLHHKQKLIVGFDEPAYEALFD